VVRTSLAFWLTRHLNDMLRILRNETFLRTLSRAAKAGISSQPWTEGLLRLEHIPTVSTSVSAIRPNGSTDTVAFKLARSALPSLPGFVIMGDKRSPVIYLQSSEDVFRASWNASTNGLLSGLDWSNVFVAGGLVLGTLLTPSLPSGLPDVQQVNTANEWQSSDIDLYIYGLDVTSANAKIRHIAEVYKKNLPQDAPFLVVRNSQTITLYSAWPQRRVQIVLKLVKDPREVLLNFDLDICAVGFDGTRPWILPRCMRALESMSVSRFHNLAGLTSSQPERTSSRWTSLTDTTLATGRPHATNACSSTPARAMVSASYRPTWLLSRRTQRRNSSHLILAATVSM
jgi:hypothetical protein